MDLNLKDLIEIVILIIIVGAYFVRIEIRLARIHQDLCWIKKELIKCPPFSGNSSQ